MTQRPERPLGNLLTQVQHTLSNQLAGGQRTPVSDLIPGAGDPNEGLIPDEFIPGVSTFDWFDPTVWAGARPDDITKVDLNAIPVPTGVGTAGTGLDWFLSGEAPNNYANRNNPLYQSRKAFIVALAPKLEDMFDVSAEGSAGYMRQPAASDAEPGGRSSNSDHYSGGALDIYGDTENLTRLRNWLVEQPFTAFVRYKSESHQTHLHVSFDVGWVAHNYFQASQLPPLVTSPPGFTLAQDAAGVGKEPQPVGPPPSQPETQEGPF